jgi:hypothetical protein
MFVKKVPKRLRDFFYACFFYEKAECFIPLLFIKWLNIMNSIFSKVSNFGKGLKLQKIQRF